MIIRPFETADAKDVSVLVRRNFMEVNIKDYSEEEMKNLSEGYHAEKVLNIAGFSHMYVISEDNEIIGCGAIASYWGTPEESILLTIFVKPELQGQGIGRSILQTLEADEYFLRAKRVEVPASITACSFYEKLGYDYKNGIKQLDEENLYRMEKFR